MLDFILSSHSLFLFNHEYFGLLVHVYTPFIFSFLDAADLEVCNAPLFIPGAGAE